MEKTIDARGQQCPKPVIMTKKAMEEAAPRYSVACTGR